MVINRDNFRGIVKIKKFEDLEVYQLSIQLTKAIYKTTENFPQKERFNITDQLIRASASIGANIAEGFGRDTTKEFIKYLYNARGSLMEVRHFINLSKELGYKIIDKDLYQKINILGVKLNNLIRALKKKQ
jgi:four helix bundle protein